MCGGWFRRATGSRIKISTAAQAAHWDEAQVAKLNAMEQFELTPVLGDLGAQLHFSQSNLLMLISALLVLALLGIGMAPKAVVPGRLQALAEMSYQGVMTMAVD